MLLRYGSKMDAAQMAFSRCPERGSEGAPARILAICSGFNFARRVRRR